MAKITEAMLSVLDTTNAVTNVYNNYLEKQAALSTQTKNIQLQNDINGELARIRQSSNYEDWNKNINEFFTRVKSGMANKDSPYYCQNNLQAEQFNKILEQNQVSVSDQVGRMVQQRQGEKEILDVQNSKTMLAQMTSGQDYIDQANKLDQALYENGRISLEQYQQQKDLNYMKAYEDMRVKTFDASLNDALAQNKSFEAFYADIEKSMPELKATDTAGLERIMDKQSLNEAIKKTCQQTYKARLNDIQQTNADSLSQIVQEMRQKNTAEGKVNVARRGQLAMNKMKGLQLSEQDRLQYSALFELALGGETTKGSGSGSGTAKKPEDSFEKYLNAAPDEAIQTTIDYPDLCPYDAAQIMSDKLLKDWFNKDYKENYDKDFAERAEAFDNLYQAKTSVESLTDSMINRLVDKYPTAANYLKNNCAKLITDMQKNPKEYGEASAGELADFMRDWVLSAPANATDEDFQTALKQHVDNCYIERCKYIELKDNGKLRDTFNAKKPADIAKAAQLASEKDFVFTDQYGNERWAKGKKEALEAPGGIVNVLQNAVVGTLGIPESEYKDLSFYYQRDESGHDMTNKPIITYKDKAYEVIANDDGKGFTVREYAVDENGKMQKVRDIEGKAGGKLQQVMRKEQKAQAAEDVSNTGRNVATLKKDREEVINKAITDSNSIPKAMKAVGTIEKEEWENVKTVENRTTYLNITERKINSDASKVEKNKMTAAEFKNKYGINYSDWTKTGERTAHYELILKS